MPLDEYPVHQVPLSMRHMASSDRNAYDRYYFNACDRTGDVFLITGFGVYPNLGVVDAFATLKVGDRQVSVRSSDALGDDRMQTAVGPYRIEIVEPLQELRLVHDAEGLAFDLRWRGSFPAAEEPPHLMRQGGKVILDACRFAQVGTWEGTISLDGADLAVDPATWVGTRDRSWGIRPVGEAEPAGRAAAEPDPDFGFWWLYLPVRFDDVAVVVIAQEDGDGHRSLNEAVRVHPDGRTEQLGWPEVEVRYRSGTRIPTGASVRLRAGGEDLVMEVESLGFVPLNCGSGYSGDAVWNHGTWKGRGWVDRVDVDLTDPGVLGMATFGVIDHVGRFTLRGAAGESVGYGLFEHGSFGRHDPSGFADFGSVAP